MSDTKNPGRSGGSSTSWESMSHEQMLAWLDQASPAMVRGAADRLRAAAEEISKIGEELKIRPQYVSWKGNGADAFRFWSGDLANATLQLATFGKESARWLAESASVIADVQAAMPRYETATQAQANLNAAQAAPQDPDSDTVARKSADELEALKASKENARQEAAEQMRKLGKAYAWSATHMNKLQRPAFPPPPLEIRPDPWQGQDRVVSRDSSGPSAAAPGPVTDASPSAGSRPPQGSDPAGTVPGTVPHLPDPPGTPGIPAPETGPDAQGPVARPAPGPSTPVGMEIDGAEPPTTTTPPHGGPPLDMPNNGRNDIGIPRTVDGLPPVVGGGPPSAGAGRHTTPGNRPPALPGRGLPESGAGRLPGGSGPILPGGQGSPRDPGRSPMGGRPPMFPGSGPVGPGTGGTPRSNGIVGGRPVPPPPGRSTGGLPRGTVIGGETGRAPAAGTAGTDTGRRPAPPGRRPPGSGGGIVGGRPRQNPSDVRGFTAGGSGLVRPDDERDTGPGGEDREGPTRRPARPEFPAADRP